MTPSLTTSVYENDSICIQRQNYKSQSAMSIQGASARIVLYNYPCCLTYTTHLVPRRCNTCTPVQRHELDGLDDVFEDPLHPACLCTGL
jgi:hypothetical protein